MNAIIVTGGKQYKVAEGDVVYIEKLDQEAGDTVKFDQVLAVIDGEKATFGTPVVEGASVEAKIVKNGKGKKIRIFKYNAKKGYRKRQGHRQPYTKVEIAIRIFKYNAKKGYRKRQGHRQPYTKVEIAKISV